MNYLPNPKKEARCAYPIAEVKTAIKQLEKRAGGEVAKLAFESDAMNMYKFLCKGKGLFNMGMFLDVSLHEVSTTHTVIQLECRRAVGAIDNAFELHECTEFMIGTFSLLGKILSGQ